MGGGEASELQRWARAAGELHQVEIQRGLGAGRGATGRGSGAAAVRSISELGVGAGRKLWQLLPGKLRRLRGRARGLARGRGGSSDGFGQEAPLSSWLGADGEESEEVFSFLKNI
jgi:hypothetical protein